MDAADRAKGDDCRTDCNSGDDGANPPGVRALQYTRGRGVTGAGEVFDSPVRLPWSGRLGALALGLGCLTLLVIATQLRPSPAGYGSHTGYPLRLQSCAFMDRTGLPCPSCGMTTSFCWFVRGNVVASAYVQPMGAVLAGLAGVCVWVSLYVAATGRPVYRLLGLLPTRYYSVPLLTLALLAWGWKIFIHLKGLDGWR